jgi:hypothetical protein
MSDGFGDWIPLTQDGVEQAPDAPAAVQLCRADRSLVQYPKGKSAMVFYFYAGRSARAALQKMFADELDEPGCKGQGPLAFRVLEGARAQDTLARLFDDFQDRFGSAPILHEK